jgi:competence protein ComEA
MKIKYVCFYVMMLLGIVSLVTGCTEKSYLEMTEESASEDTWDTDPVGSDTTESAGTAVQASETAEEESQSTLYVQVSGAVVSPGVYALPEGSRVYEALAMAGGMTQDACDLYLNQAVKLSDGERIYIPTAEEVADGDFDADGAGLWSNVGSVESTGSYAGLVNINTASADVLMTLQGIGETRAQAIIAYRQEHGTFSSKEDIKNVSGIGDSIYAGIADSITVD